MGSVFHDVDWFCPPPSLRIRFKWFAIGIILKLLSLIQIIRISPNRKLRQGRAQQTLFNLALALLCSWLVFLAGIEQTHNYVGCLIVAVMLHYFILVSFMWMLMEAILQYLTFVKVLGTYITRFTLKTVLPSWGGYMICIINDNVSRVEYFRQSIGNIIVWCAKLFSNRLAWIIVSLLLFLKQY